MSIVDETPIIRCLALPWSYFIIGTLYLISDFRWGTKTIIEIDSLSQQKILQCLECHYYHFNKKIHTTFRHLHFKLLSQSSSTSWTNRSGDNFCGEHVHQVKCKDPNEVFILHWRPIGNRHKKEERHVKNITWQMSRSRREKNQINKPSEIKCGAFLTEWPELWLR